MNELESGFTFKTKDCFDCLWKREDVCYWGTTAFRITALNPDGTVHRRQKCQRRWEPQPEGHVDLPEKGS